MVRLSVVPLLTALVLTSWGCFSPAKGPSTAPNESEPPAASVSPSANQASTPDLEGGRFAVATFAGGCFWCMQPPFDKLAGVKSTLVGYTGGPEQHPAYEDVSRGRTGHAEAVEILFDPQMITYDELLHVFWRSIDPTTKDRQFADKGRHYRTSIFYHDEAQREAAIRSRDELQANGPFDKPIVTEIVPAQTFWIAEEYHQQYYLKNPRGYQQYYVGSGRAGFLERTWRGR
jgi:methionine-S-sulfoxide reductase